MVRRRQSPSAVPEALVSLALERFTELLRDKSLKLSREREAIARAALAYEGHFTVDDLVRALQAAGVSDAHVATVYRAMPLLVEARLVQPALVAQGESQHYEATFGRAHHDHLVCRSCGRVVEYESEALEVLQREIAARYEFELVDHIHELRGRCGACRRAEARATN